MYLKNNPNNPIHLFLIGGVGIGKTFVLRLINQELKQLYNKDLSLILTKQKLYSWHLQVKLHLILMVRQYIHFLTYLSI